MTKPLKTGALFGDRRQYPLSQRRRSSLPNEWCCQSASPPLGPVNSTDNGRPLLRLYTVWRRWSVPLAPGPQRAVASTARSRYFPQRSPTSTACLRVSQNIALRKSSDWHTRLKSAVVFRLATPISQAIFEARSRLALGRPTSINVRANASPPSTPRRRARHLLSTARPSKSRGKNSRTDGQLHPIKSFCKIVRTRRAKENKRCR